MKKEVHQRDWWGEHPLELGGTAMWEIGPLRFWLQRSALEWRLAHEWDESEGAAGWARKSAEWPGDEVDAERFAVGETTDGVRLRPLPSDRPVVARPKTALRVLPAERARVYISSPLWVEVATGDEPTVLRELPAKRLSETWFGASTREGELSYAVKTSAHTDLREMPRAPYRLLSPVVIENQADDPLSVERINLPVPFVTVYGSTDGEVWSNEIHMLRTESGDMAALDARVGPPAEAEDAVELSAPRDVARRGQLIRAFGSLLGFD